MKETASSALVYFPGSYLQFRMRKIVMADGTATTQFITSELIGYLKLLDKASVNLT